jgi:hypothetical protein
MERSNEWTAGTSKAIMAALRDRVSRAAGRRGDRIVVRQGPNWTSWRSRRRDRVFAEIRPLRGRVQVFILPGPKDLRDGGGIARSAPRTQGWGWFRSRLEVTSMARVESAAQLIVQSYERVIQAQDGHRRQRRVRGTRGL